MYSVLDQPNLGISRIPLEVLELVEFDHHHIHPAVVNLLLDVLVELLGDVFLPTQHEGPRLAGKINIEVRMQKVAGLPCAILIQTHVNKCAREEVQFRKTCNMEKNFISDLNAVWSLLVQLQGTQKKYVLFAKK